MVSIPLLFPVLVTNRSFQGDGVRHIEGRLPAELTYLLIS